MIPKLTVPLYDVTCPSGIKVSFRPWLVKEEKLLMIAMQSKDTDTILKTARQVLENCVGTISNIDVDKLPLFDVEFLFLNVRARSVGEEITLRYKCNQNVVDANTGIGVICNTMSEYPVDLLSIKPVFGPGHNKHIQLSESIGLTLRYPTFKSFRTIVREELPPNEAFDFLVECVESINDQDKLVLTKDEPKADVIEFMESLTHDQVSKVDNFFQTMPKIEMLLHFKCPKCNYEEDILVKGLDSFFA